jgi:hypothetical protein
MAKQLLDQKIGTTGISVGVRADDDGNIGVDLQYPMHQLEAPLTALLGKIAAKVPFLQRYVAAAVAGIMAAIGYKAPAQVAAPVVEADAAPAASTVAAHEAEPVEAAPL